MAEETEYRITYSIERLMPGDDDFVEVGFGSTSSWDALDACTFELESTVTRGEWETEPGHPDPEQILDDISKARHGW